MPNGTKKYGHFRIPIMPQCENKGKEETSSSDTTERIPPYFTIKGHVRLRKSTGEAGGG